MLNADNESLSDQDTPREAESSSNEVLSCIKKLTYAAQRGKYFEDFELKLRLLRIEANMESRATSTQKQPSIISILRNGQN